MTTRSATTDPVAQRQVPLAMRPTLRLSRWRGRISAPAASARTAAVTATHGGADGGAPRDGAAEQTAAAPRARHPRVRAVAAPMAVTTAPQVVLAYCVRRLSRLRGVQAVLPLRHRRGAKRGALRGGSRV